MAYVDVHSKAVILLLHLHCLLLLQVFVCVCVCVCVCVGSIFCDVLLLSFLVYQSSRWGRERDGAFH